LVKGQKHLRLCFELFIFLKQIEIMEIKKLIENYDYYYHSTSIMNMESIKNNGLQLVNMHKSAICPQYLSNKPLVCFANAKHIFRVEGGFFLTNSPTQADLLSRVILRIKAESITKRLFSFDYTDTAVELCLKKHNGSKTELELYEIILDQIGTLACYEAIPFNELEVIERTKIKS
jgi:hypothetical protein